MQAVRTVMWVCGIGALVLGLAFWLGHALAPVSVHVALGALLVVALWVLAALAVRSGANRGSAVMAVVVGAIVPVVGAYQGLVPTGGGWDVLRTAHLLVGVVAIAQGETLSRAILRPRLAKRPWWEERS